MLFTGRAVASIVSAFTLIAGLLAPAAAQTPTVRVGGTGNYGPVIPIIAGQKLGLFEKAGVKVEFTNFSGGSASMEGLAAGEVDLINFFPPGLALARSRGVKATIVSAGTITPRGWQIMVKKDSPITDPKQLVGKKIGISANGSTTDFFALWVANRAGGAVTRVPVGGGGLIPNLISGNVDAIVAFPPLSYRLTISGDGRMLVDLGKDMKPNLPDVWIASDKMLKDNPDAIKRALVGLFSAIKYMKSNPDWSIKFIQEQTKFDEVVAKAEFENTIMGLSDNGEMKEEWIAESLELGKLAGLANLPPPKEIFTTQFVPVQTIAP
jgi:NitT/TauT family transport system substrate-binding protein